MLGGLLGPATEVSAASGPSDDDIQTSLRSFTKVYEAVEQNYADPLSPDKAIYNGAIPSMLHTLDPHSNFYDPKQFAAMREEQRGQYYGVGMLVGPRGSGATSRTIVIEPFTGSPANRAGLHRGDAITVVDDHNTAGLTTTEVTTLLKGQKGTPVQITVAREGAAKPLVFNVVRDEISRPSVGEAFWLRPGIAYVDINLFNENTSHELEEQLSKLGENKIQGLVLDLRDNPGGLLNEAVEVAGHFLKKGMAVVKHRGRVSPEKVFYARHGETGREYPIVVLVNRSTASAAEIVSGALQDHDRGWILGETTFGKGLVQTVFPLAENSGLALTTYHYYTPSGRLIQRDYSHISFVEYYTHREKDLKNLQDVKMTDSGRTVYGGGGITPDEKFQAPKLNKFQIEILRKNFFFDYAPLFFASRGTTKLPQDWAPDTATMDAFHAYCLKQKGEFTEADWTENNEWLKQALRQEIYITAFSKEASDKVGVENDPTAMKGIEAMPEAKKLLESAKKMLVQRTNPNLLPQN
ncbi:MAG TPA: S41 family peptidase [Bryobacteraceae bacterium]